MGLLNSWRIDGDIFAQFLDLLSLSLRIIFFVHSSVRIVIKTQGNLAKIIVKYQPFNDYQSENDEHDSIFRYNFNTNFVCDIARKRRHGMWTITGGECWN